MISSVEISKIKLGDLLLDPEWVEDFERDKDYGVQQIDFKVETKYYGMIEERLKQEQDLIIDYGGQEIRFSNYQYKVTGGSFNSNQTLLHFAVGCTL